MRAMSNASGSAIRSQRGDEMSRHSLAAMSVIMAPTLLAVMLFCSALIISRLLGRPLADESRRLILTSIALVFITAFLQVAWIRGPGLMLASTVEHCGIGRGIPLAFRRMAGDAFYPPGLDPCR